MMCEEGSVEKIHSVATFFCIIEEYLILLQRKEK